MSDCRKMHPKTPDPFPVTEEENPRTANLSWLPVAQIVQLMNQEDEQVAAAVARVLPQVVQAVEGIVKRLSAGGRLFYIGTGTSGRLGVLDAAECPPTFGVSPDIVQAIIAGGYEACYRAVEASEDDAESGQRDLQTRSLAAEDALVGIAASGRTPYTVGALAYGQALGALTIAVTCAPDSPVTRVAAISIVPVVGAEVIAGSTRLKAGTAQKMVLNMLSTASMVQLGYVTGNRMTGVQARNAKLRERALRILIAESGLKPEAAAQALGAAEGDLRLALLMTRTGRSLAESRDALAASKGVVQEAMRALLEGT